VYEKKPDEPGAYRCISRFEFPGALKTKRLLFCGRNHCSVLKATPKIMLKAGNKVAVELREGCGCRADSDRDAYVSIAMGAPSTGDTVRRSLSHRDRVNVEQRRVIFWKRKRRRWWPAGSLTWRCMPPDMNELLGRKPMAAD
jgi:hypothetical protein